MRLYFRIAFLTCCFLIIAVLVPLPASMAYASSTNTFAPGYALWDETSVLINSATSKIMPSQDELPNLHGAEGVHTSSFLIFLLSY
jgi:hypothetical protein